MTIRAMLSTTAFCAMAGFWLPASSAELQVYQQDQQNNRSVSSVLYDPEQSQTKLMAISEHWHLKCVKLPDNYQSSIKRCELDPTNGVKEAGDRHYRLLDGVKVELWNIYDPYRDLHPDVSVRIKGVIFNKKMVIEVGDKRFEKQARNQQHGYEWYSSEAGEIVQYLLNYPHLKYEYDLFARHINRSYQSLEGFREVWDFAVKFTGFNPLL